MKGDLTYAVEFWLNYDVLMKQLYSIFFAKTYKNYATVRLVLDGEGHLLYLPTQEYKLLSMPLNTSTLFPKNGKNTKINTSLLQSSDPEVQKMAKHLITNNHGELNVKIKGETYLLFFETLPVNNWTIAVLIKKSELYQPLVQVENTFDLIFNKTYENYIISFALILVIGLLISFFIFRKIFIIPVETLRYNFVRLGRGNFNLKLKEKGIREIFDLSKTFNELGVQLKHYTSNLEHEIKTRQSIETELEIAGRLQSSVIPKITDKFKSAKFELYAKLIPAEEMSGDFYDFYYIREDVLSIVLADVSGKGLSAAFYMSMSKAIIKEVCLTLKSLDPSKALNKINKILCKSDDSCMFLTMYLIFYNINTGNVVYSNAGHHEFITVDKNSTTEVTGILNNLAIGLAEDAEYSNSELTLSPGQVLAVYTDGITEAPNKNENEFGTDKLEEIFIKNNDKNLDELGNSVIDEVLEFQDENKFDDITLLMLKRKE